MEKCSAQESWLCYFCFFELLPFVNFHFEFLSGSLRPNYESYQLETSQTDTTHAIFIKFKIVVCELFQFGRV